MLCSLICIFALCSIPLPNSFEIQKMNATTIYKGNCAWPSAILSRKKKACDALSLPPAKPALPIVAQDTLPWSREHFHAHLHQQPFEGSALLCNRFAGEINGPARKSVIWNPGSEGDTVVAGVQNTKGCREDFLIPPGLPLSFPPAFSPCQLDPCHSLGYC